MATQSLDRFLIHRDPLESLLRALPSDRVVGQPLGDFDELQGVETVPGFGWIDVKECLWRLSKHRDSVVVLREKEHGWYLIQLGGKVVIEAWSDLYGALLEHQAHCLEALPRYPLKDRALERLRERAAALLAKPAMVSERLKDPSESVRVSWAGQLSTCPDRTLLTRAMDGLISASADPSHEVRNHVAIALGKTKDPRPTAVLTALLKDPHLHVRSAAAFSLGASKDPRAVDPLIEALEASAHEGASPESPGAPASWAAAKPHVHLRETMLAALEALGHFDQGLRDRTNAFTIATVVAWWIEAWLEASSWAIGRVLAANFHREGARASDELATIIRALSQAGSPAIERALGAAAGAHIELTPNLERVLVDVAKMPWTTLGAPTCLLASEVLERLRRPAAARR